MKNSQPSTYMLSTSNEPNQRPWYRGAVVYKAGKVQNGGNVVPHPHVLGRTTTRCRVHWGPVSGWWCGPSRVQPHPHLFEASSPERIGSHIDSSRIAGPGCSGAASRGGRKVQKCSFSDLCSARHVAGVVCLRISKTASWACLGRRMELNGAWLQHFFADRRTLKGFVPWPFSRCCLTLASHVTKIGHRRT